MTENHATLIYKSDTVLYTKIVEFFATGIDNSERCVFLTTKSDGDKIFQNLKKLKDKSKVVKLFSYYSLPDPVRSPTEFEEKSSKIFKTIFDENFCGRIAFHVLGDMSRFSSEAISKVEKAEKFLHSIASSKRKFFCTLKTGEENESSEKMMKIALDTHDHAIYEKDNGHFSKVSLN